MHLEVIAAEHAVMHRPNSRALRRGRWSEQGRIYLVTFVTAGRVAHFAEWEPAARIARALACTAAWGDGLPLCWMLMPDHWHGLVELGARNLSGSVGKAKAHASRIWHDELARKERLWMPGFHDHALRKEESVQTAARYIIANPVRAGLVAKPGDYPFWDAIWLNH